MEKERKNEFFNMLGDLLCDINLPEDAPVALKAHHQMLVFTHKYRDRILEAIGGFETADEETSKKLYGILTETNAKLDAVFNGAKAEDTPKQEAPKEEQKFYVGQRVQFKEREEIEENIYFFGMVPAMFPLCGTFATIAAVSGKNVELKDFSAVGVETNWCYNTAMFKPI